MKKSCVVIAGLLMSLLLVSECFAHKITVFGYVEQGTVKTESMFSGGRVAQNCKLSIADPSGTILIGKTDDKGMLDFPVPDRQAGFDLVVVCGDGHRGSWRIEADEFLDLSTAATGTQPEANTSPQPLALESTTSSALRQIIREELATEIGPLKRQLAQLKQDTISLADIMGGLGYFLGLAGLASYMRYRKESK